MNFKVLSKRLNYNITFYGKYSVIQGDSGNGKTNLCRLLHDRELGDKTIKIESELDVIALNPNDTIDRLSEIKGKIIIIDEFYKILSDRNLSNALKNSNNYFIIISRKKMDFLPLAVDSLYDMKTDGKNHWIEPRYIVDCKKQFYNIKEIITEDSVSGLYFFREFFPEIKSSSANSKSQIIDYLKKRLQEDNSFNNILIVYDSSAFAYNKESLDVFLDKSRLSFQYLDWYSFENYVLTQQPFNYTLLPKDIDYTYEGLEQASE